MLVEKLKFYQISISQEFSSRKINLDIFAPPVNQMWPDVKKYIQDLKKWRN